MSFKRKICTLVGISSAFWLQPVNAALQAGNCHAAYREHLQTAIGSDSNWIKIQKEVFELAVFSKPDDRGNPSALSIALSRALFLIELPVYPLVWPVAGTHDLILKAKKAIYKQTHAGELQTYALLDLLGSLYGDIVNTLNTDIQQRYVAEITTAPTTEYAKYGYDGTFYDYHKEVLSQKMLDELYVTYTENTAYHDLINSEPFATLAKDKHITPEQYREFVKYLLDQYAFGTEFCGNNPKAEIKKLAQIKL